MLTAISGFTTQNCSVACGERSRWRRVNVCRPLLGQPVLNAGDRGEGPTRVPKGNAICRGRISKRQRQHTAVRWVLGRAGQGSLEDNEEPSGRWPETTGVAEWTGAENQPWEKQQGQRAVGPGRRELRCSGTGRRGRRPLGAPSSLCVHPWLVYGPTHWAPGQGFHEAGAGAGRRRGTQPCKQSRARAGWLLAAVAHSHLTGMLPSWKKGCDQPPRCRVTAGGGGLPGGAPSRPLRNLWEPPRA